MNGGMGGMSMWGMEFGGPWMIVVWIFVIAAIVLVVKWIAGGHGRDGALSRSPSDILRERYARGEIGREEYERMRRDLGGQDRA